MIAGWNLSDKIAAVAIGVGFLQFVVLLATVCVMVRTARRQLRAYVMIESVRLENIFDGGKPEAVITLKNSGQTPASKLTQLARLGFNTFPEITGPIHAKGQKKELPEGAMAPGATLIVRTGIDLPLNGPTIIALNTKRNAFYLQGEVRYTDAFGTRRETDFLLFSTGELTSQGSMASYKTGNRIT